jgi:hypothetical protein
MLACTGQILSHAIIDNVLSDIYSYTWYASLRGLSQNTIVPSLAISTLCLLGYVSSTSSASTMPEYCFAFFGDIDTLPLELFASWATLAFWAILPLWALYRHFASQAMSHRHCLLWQCRYTDMPLGLCHRWALVSMQNDKLCYYAKPGYSVRPDTIRDMMLVNFEIDVSIYYWARIGDNWKDYRMPWYASMPKYTAIWVIDRCLDMLANRNKRWLGILIDAMICWHTEILLLPWYIGILKFCSCHDIPAYWNFAHAMICWHTETLLMPWYTGILKYMWLKISLNSLMY